MREKIAIQLCDPMWTAHVELQSLKRIGAGGLADVYRYDRSEAERYALKLYRVPQQADWSRIDFLISEFGTKTKQRGASARIAWPIGRISRASTSVGIVLPLFDATKHQALDYWIEPPLQKKLKPEQDALSSRLTIIKNLASTLTGLHDHGIAVIDLKPSNVLVADDLSIVMLDADSFGIRRINGARFAPTHVSPSYIAPEAYAEHIDVPGLWHEQDKYAFAVIAFQILNYGVHPFQCILDQSIPGTDTNDDKAKAGLYAYGLTQHQLARPVSASAHAAWPSSLRLLFDRAFTQKIHRPSPAEWLAALSEILETKKLDKCKLYPGDMRHIRFAGMECARCMRDRANAAIIRASGKPAASNKSSGSPTNTAANSNIAQPARPGWVSAYKVLGGFALFIVALLAIANTSHSPPSYAPVPNYVPPTSYSPPPNYSQPPSYSPPPRIAEYAPTFDRNFHREEVFGDWVLQVQRDGNGEVACVLFYGGVRGELLRSNGLRTGIGWTPRSGERFFYDSFTIAQVPLNSTIDNMSFFHTYMTSYDISGGRRRHQYMMPPHMIRPFVDGSTMTIGGAPYSLRGSSNAYKAFQDCKK